MSDYFTIWAWTANFGRADSYDQANAAYNKLVNHFDSNGNPADLLGLQEMDEGDKGYSDHTLMHKHLSDYQWAGESKMVPIAVHPSWEIVHARSTDVHPGLSGVTPARTITDCLIRHKTHTWCEVGWINSHAVAGAFTHPDQSHERDRRDDWFWWWGAMKMRTADYVRGGHSVILTMDSNNPDQPKIHDSERRFIHSGFDYVLVCEPGDPAYSMKKANSKVVDLGIDDHEARAAAIQFTRK